MRKKKGYEQRSISQLQISCEVQRETNPARTTNPSTLLKPTSTRRINRPDQQNPQPAYTKQNIITTNPYQYILIPSSRTQNPNLRRATASADPNTADQSKDLSPPRPRNRLRNKAINHEIHQTKEEDPRTNKKKGEERGI